MGTLHEDVCTFVMFFSVLVTMRNFSKKKNLEDFKTHIIFNKTFRQLCHL